MPNFWFSPNFSKYFNKYCFFVATLKNGIKVFERTLTRKKYLRLAFLCSFKVWKFVSFWFFFGQKTKKLQKWTKTPQNSLKPLIFEIFKLRLVFQLLSPETTIMYFRKPKPSTFWPCPVYMCRLYLHSPTERKSRLEMAFSGVFGAKVPKTD